MLTLNKMKFLLMVACGSIFLVGVSSVNVTHTKYSNGCIKVHASDSVSPLDPFQRPFLNCSSLGKTSFDLSSIPDDIKSISFSHNKISKFDVRTLTRFTSLTSLDFSHNLIAKFTPTPENGTLDSVKTVSVSVNKLTAVPNDLLGSIPEANNVDVSNNKISKITDEDFTPLKRLSVVVFGGNPLSSISPKAFHKFNQTLMAISVSYAGLGYVPAFLKNISSLIYVSLVGNQISYLPRKAFEGDIDLRWLELARNRIMRIDRLAFSGTKKLRLLDLTDNQIETLPYGVFDDMPVYEQITIELYENPINCNCSMQWFKRWYDELLYKDIRLKCFQPLVNHGKKWHNLTRRDLTCESDAKWAEDCSHVAKPAIKPPTNKPPESKLCPRGCECYNSTGAQYYPRTIPAAAVSKRRKKIWWVPVQYPYVDCSKAGLTRLPPTGVRADVQTLNFMNSRFSSVNIRDFRKYSQLKILYLEGSGIRRINPDTGTVLKTLTHLSVQHNNITSFGRAQLKSFPNLKMLRMANNKIYRFDRNMFADTRAINRLYLGPNPAKNFDSAIISGLDLYSLSLRNLSLKTIPRLNAPNLLALKLSDNFLTSIPNNTFDNTPSLFRATFDNNKISHIASAAFNKSYRLRKIDLSENLIERLPPGVFDSMNKDGLNVELWMNPIYCDCRMKWFKQWLDKLEIYDPTTDIRFMCMLPIRNFGKTSEILSPEDFTCEPGDKGSALPIDLLDVVPDYHVYKYGRCHSDGQMALAVILTMVITVFMTLCLRWCICSRRHRYGYKRHTESPRLELDDQ